MDSFTFLVSALSDADSRGLMTDDLDVLLYGYIIKNLIVPLGTGFFPVPYKRSV